MNDCDYRTVIPPVGRCATGVLSRVCRRALALTLFALLQISRCSFAQEQPQAPDEYTVKAAFLYNFTKYIDWPTNAFESPESPFVIGVLGDVPPELDRALVYYQQKKQTHGRTIAVRDLSSADEAANCHVVFVRNSLDDERVAEVVERCGDRPILLVGEADTFLGQGGGINFTVLDDKVQFRLALKAIADRRLKPDAKLLRVAAEIVN